MSHMVPRAGVEPARPCGHYALNVARLPFRHLGNLIPILIQPYISVAPAVRGNVWSLPRTPIQGTKEH